MPMFLVLLMLGRWPDAAPAGCRALRPASRTVHRRLGVVSIANGWLLLLLAGLVPAVAHAAPALEVNRTAPGSMVGLSIDYFEDADGRLELADAVRQLARFQPSPSAAPGFGYTRSAYWFHLRLHNNGDAPVRSLFENQYSLVDDMRWYVLRDGEVAEQFISGRRLPFSERPLRHRNLIHPVDLDSGESVDVFIRLQTSGALQLPLVLWSADTLARREHKEHLLLGIYYGVLVSVFLFNLLMACSIRDISYAHYVQCVGCYILFQLALNGLAFEFLWPNSPAWGRMCIPLFIQLTLFGALNFCRSFLEMPVRFPRFDRLLRGYALVLMALALASLFAPYTYMTRIAAATALFSACLIPAVGLLCLSRRIQQAKYFTLAWAMLFVGVALYALKSFAVIPASFLTEYGLQIGSAVETVLLSFALAHRMKLLKEENERIQLHAQSVLEARVLERTRALDVALRKLSGANAELQQLNTIDSLTRVRNRRYFDRFFETQLLRSKRTRCPIALLMVDIDHFKNVNDVHGHPAGDECLRQTANAMAALLRRPGDCLARYGGEEFAVVLSDTDAKGALQMAEKLRASVQALVLVHAGIRIRVTVSIGVAVSQDIYPESSSAVIGRGDAALYDAKRTGRNRVLFCASP